MLNGWSFYNNSTLLVNTRVEKSMWSRMPFPKGILYFVFWKVTFLDFIKRKIFMRIDFYLSIKEVPKDNPYTIQEGYLFRNN